jgi:hypothetical protein
MYKIIKNGKVSRETNSKEAARIRIRDGLSYIQYSKKAIKLFEAKRGIKQ